MPEPRFVISMGSCANGGGYYRTFPFSSTSFVGISNPIHPPSCRWKWTARLTYSPFASFRLLLLCCARSRPNRAGRSLCKSTFYLAFCFFDYPLCIFPFPPPFSVLTRLCNDCRCQDVLQLLRRCYTVSRISVLTRLCLSLSLASPY